MTELYNFICDRIRELFDKKHIICINLEKYNKSYTDDRFVCDCVSLQRNIDNNLESHLIKNVVNIVGVNRKSTGHIALSMLYNKLIKENMINDAKQLIKLFANVAGDLPSLTKNKHPMPIDPIESIVKDKTKTSVKNHNKVLVKKSSKHSFKKLDKESNESFNDDQPLMTNSLVNKSPKHSFKKLDKDGSNESSNDDQPTMTKELVNKPPKHLLKKLNKDVSNESFNDVKKFDKNESSESSSDKSSSKTSSETSGEMSGESSGDSLDDSSTESDDGSAKNEMINVLGGIFSSVKPQLQDIVTNMESKPPDGVHYGKQVHDRIRDIKKGINDFEKIITK
jgi:hypothetical protein